MYRVWDAANKEMLYGEQAIKGHNKSSKFIAGCLGILQIMTIHAKNTVVDFAGSNYRKLDCTGVPDKKGRLIYEGDIVEMKRKEVSGDIHRFVVAWDTNKAGFYLIRVHMWVGLAESYAGGEHINGKNKTVIGNIYENANLL